MTPPDDKLPDVWVSRHGYVFSGPGAQNVENVDHYVPASRLAALQAERDALAEQVRVLMEQLSEANDERDHLLADWNAIVKASGSRTHGAAIGHVARLVAAKEQAERELAGARAHFARYEKD